MSTAIMKVEPQRGLSTREEFGSQAVEQRAETATAAVAARERAKIEAAYVMAERHPRDWETVRVRVLSHCDRVGFAEVARYKKPAGNAMVNGQWKQTFAEGLSARFAEVARQEMGNVRTETAIVYEDAFVRIISAGVTDLERNSIEQREFTIPKATEKKGKKDRGGNWAPPEGREVLGERVNSYGDPVYLVRATEDEMRSKQNAEISKIQRDCTLRLMPKDIRDEAEARILGTLADPKKQDPVAARRKVIDGFAKIGVLPDDLVAYLGCAVDRCSPAQLDELRALWTAINDGETTFNEAMRIKYDAADPGENETPAERDIRLQKQMDQQATAAERRIEELRGQQAESTGQSNPAPDAASNEQPAQAAGEENAPPPNQTTAAPQFGHRPARGFGGRK